MKTMMRLVDANKSSNVRKQSGRNSFISDTPRNAQRVVVKARVVKNSGPFSKGSIRNHVSYISRDAVKNHNEVSPIIYSETGITTKENLEETVREFESDRHHFRFIISPENAHDLNLTEYTKALVKQMELDLDTKLTFIAVNHYNTDNLHVHLIVRGVDDSGKNLVIKRDYISNGFRFRASQIATKTLGLRTEREIRNGITSEVKKTRFTQIDRDLLAKIKVEKCIDLRKPIENGFSEFKRNVQIQRLRFLKTMQLSREIKPGIWKLNEECEKTLRELGLRNDIIKTMHEQLKNERITEHIIFDPADSHQRNITGVVIEKGLSNELYDEKYLIVSATDNRAYYVPLSKYSETPAFEARPGSIVTVSVKRGESQQRIADENILEIASRNNGIYNRELHLKSINTHRLPQGVTPENYVENHLKRIEALEKRGVVERAENGWSVPENLKEKIIGIAHESGGKNNFVQVKLESMQDMHHQKVANAPTWLDREMSEGRLPRPDALQSSFCSEMDRAKSERLQKLHAMGLAEKTHDCIRIKPDYHEHLYKRQMEQAAKDLSSRFGKPARINPGETFSGACKGIHHLPSGPHVIVKRGNEFVIVPHQRGMERMNQIRLEMPRTQDTQYPELKFASLDTSKERDLGR